MKRSLAGWLRDRGRRWCRARARAQTRRSRTTWWRATPARPSRSVGTAARVATTGSTTTTPSSARCRTACTRARCCVLRAAARAGRRRDATDARGEVRAAARAGDEHGARGRGSHVGRAPRHGRAIERRKLTFRSSSVAAIREQIARDRARQLGRARARRRNARRGARGLDPQPSRSLSGARRSS